MVMLLSERFNTECLYRLCHITSFSLHARKREEEQRRRDAVQRVSAAEKQRPPVVTPEQETNSFVNMIEDLTMSDSVAETKMPTKAESAKSKGEKHKGTSGQKPLLGALVWNEVMLFVLLLTRLAIYRNKSLIKIYLLSPNHFQNGRMWLGSHKFLLFCSM